MEKTDIVAGAIVMLLISIVLATILGHADAASTVFGVKIFIEVWMLLGIVSTFYGVTVYHHSVAEEARTTLILFGTPILLAAILWWRFS